VIIFVIPHKTDLQIFRTLAFLITAWRLCAVDQPEVFSVASDQQYFSSRLIWKRSLVLWVIPAVGSALMIPAMRSMSPSPVFADTKKHSIPRASAQARASSSGT
jgi:hypothetical protein